MAAKTPPFAGVSVTNYCIYIHVAKYTLCDIKSMFAFYSPAHSFRPEISNTPQNILHDLLLLLCSKLLNHFWYALPTYRTQQLHGMNVRILYTTID